MRRIFPVDDTGSSPEVDPLEEYANDARPAPPDRPWVLLNMINSLDGAISVDGRSGGIGGPPDKLVFAAIRAIPDVILVGSGTVAAENYGPPNPSAAVRRLRAARGQAERPRLAIITANLNLDPEGKVFSDPADRPLVITSSNPPEAACARLEVVADVLRFGGDGHVDLGAALAHLRTAGTTTVLCEGGPTLNGAVLDAGVLDELCLSLSPIVVGGESGRIVHGATAGLRPVTLDRVLEQDGMLFSRYLTNV